MPHYFGKDHPDISDVILANITSGLDDRDFILTLPNISKAWRLTIKSEMFDKKILDDIIRRTACVQQTSLIARISSGYSNTNYKISDGDTRYVLRIPIMKNHILIDRSYEKYNTIIAYELGLGAGLMFYEISTGIMVTRYIDNKSTVPQEHRNTLMLMSGALRQLHRSKVRFHGNWDIFEKIKLLYGFIEKHFSVNLTKIAENLLAETNAIKDYVLKLKIETCPCHNDPSPNNFLYHDGEMKMIDWEFSGNNDPMWDLAFLAAVSELNADDETLLLNAYFKTRPEDIDYYRFTLYKPLAHFWIGMLSLLQIYNCNIRLDKTWLIKVATERFNKAKKLFDDLRDNKVCVKLTECAQKNDEAPHRMPAISTASELGDNAAMLSFGMKENFVKLQKISENNKDKLMGNSGKKHEKKQKHFCCVL